MPNNIVGINLSSGKELVFKIKTKAGEVDLVQNTFVNITGSLPTNKSTYTITLIAKSDHVEISYK